MKLIDAATWYVDQGFSIIPIKDKLPTIKWKDFQSRLATKAEIKTWFGNEEGLAIITGKQSGITVVDADSDASVKIVEDTLSGIKVPTVTTPGGGKHFYFQYLSSTRNVQGIKDKLDIRSEGGYVVAPPTERNGAGPYHWEKGKNLEVLDLLPMPKALVSILYSTAISPLGLTKDLKSSNIDIDSTIEGLPNAEVQQGDNRNVQQGVTGVTDADGCNNVLQSVTSVARVPVGKRDAAMFHVANCLIKGGMTEREAKVVLLIVLQYMCEEDPSNPFSEKEAMAKIQSALDRDGRFKRSWKDEILVDLETRLGEFNQVDMYRELDALSRNDKTAIRVTLKRLSEADNPIIERCQRGGSYKKVEGTPESIDWKNAKTNTYAIDLPFGLNDYVDIFPGDLLLFAGSPDSGKTAVMIDIAKRNGVMYPINYWSTEISPAGLKLKLQNDPSMKIDDWNINYYEYSSPYQLDPTGFNIIDYIEELDEPHKVSGILKAIHLRMKKGGGVCAICIQKDPKKKIAWGGFMTTAKPMLYLGLDTKNDLGKVTVIKAKNTPMVDCTGYVGYYKVSGGAVVEMVQPLERKEKQEVI